MATSVPVNADNKLSFRFFTEADREAVVNLSLSWEDKQEVAAFGFNQTSHALHTSLNAGGDIRVIEKNGEIVGVFGVRDGMDHKTGVIWFVGLEEAKKPLRQFLSLSKRIVNNWNQIYPTLTNLVWSGNTKAIRWLKYLGFTVLDQAQPMKINGIPLYQFYRVIPRN